MAHIDRYEAELKAQAARNAMILSVGKPVVVLNLCAVAVALFAMYSIGGYILVGLAAVVGGGAYFAFKEIIKENTKDFKNYLVQKAQEEKLIAIQQAQVRNVPQYPGQ